MVTEQHYCHCVTVLQVETNIEAYLLSEFINQNSITVPLPNADEDFTKKEQKAKKKQETNSWQEKLETSQVSKSQRINFSSSILPRRFSVRKACPKFPEPFFCKTRL